MTIKELREIIIKFNILKMNKTLLYSGMVLTAGLSFRAGWEACLRLAPDVPEQVYFLQEIKNPSNNSKNNYSDKIIFKDVKLNLLKFEAEGIGIDGKRYSGKYYPLESRAEIGVEENNLGRFK